MQAQIIIVGSGINSLVCAALLATKGKRVLVLERNDRLGGCIRTETLFPGYHHDILSSWYPLFTGSPSYAALKPELDKAGLVFVQGDYTTGLVMPDGRALALKQDIADTVSRLNAITEGDGSAIGAMADQLFQKDAALTFGLFGNNPYGWDTTKLLYQEWRKRGLDGLLGFASNSLESFRRWSERCLTSDFSRAMIAPWVLHTGVGPDDASSALIGKLTFAAVVAGGMPVVQGGSEQLVKALKTVIENHGGSFMLNTEVENIVLENSLATGVIANGQHYFASQAVVCNVTPLQLYTKLLPNAPEDIRKSAKNYRFGRGDMQIHFALSQPPAWCEPELLKVPLVHLTESMEQVSLSVVVANNGLLPDKPTIAIGQPTAVDPTRAPEGAWILWIQMQELPSRIKGDFAGEIKAPAEGRWTEEIRERFADRVQARIEQVMPGLGKIIVGRRAYSPADLEHINCNLVGGDPYSGICSPDQFFWLRPFAAKKSTKGHRTPYRNVFHIGASTHPGPGLGGGSGYLVAQQLMRK